MRNNYLDLQTLIKMPKRAVLPYLFIFSQMFSIRDPTKMCMSYAS
jgi:hypothetical protein